jgi:anti-sigma regulatory factor (Ser/Thr protein kinase)
VSAPAVDLGCEWPEFEGPFDLALLEPFATATHFAADEDPRRLRRPDLTLVEPSLGQSRRAVQRLTRSSRLDAGDLATLLATVTELLTNAEVHGLPPVVLRAWRSGDRVLVTVSDVGVGPSPPPARARTPLVGSGVGLSLVRAMCDAIGFTRTAAGFTAWALTLAGRDSAGAG